MDYLSKCRLCFLEVESSEDAIPLYHKCNDVSTRHIDDKIVSMIYAYVEVKVDNITTLPPQICLQCFTELTKYKAFKERCQATDLELKRILELSQNVKIEVEVKSEEKVAELLTPEVTLAEEDPDQLSTCEALSSSCAKPVKGKLIVRKLSELTTLVTSEVIDDSSKQVFNISSNDDSCDYDEDMPLSDVLSQMNKAKSKKGKYKCSLCKETFRRQVAKEVHEKEHKQLYKCVLCYDSFLTHTRLQKHRADVHNEDPYCCSFCSESFADVHIWTDHMKSQHVTCQKCKSYFRNNTYLDGHSCVSGGSVCSPEESQNRIQYDFPSPVKKNKCPYDKKKYVPKKNYYMLKKMRLLAEAQACDAQRQGGLEDLMKKCTTYTCARCYLEFPDQAALIQHRSTLLPCEVAQEKKKIPATFPCFRCHMDFADKGALICHQAVVHPGQPIDNTQRPPKKSVLFCKDCLLFFRHISDMQAHLCPRIPQPMLRSSVIRMGPPAPAPGPAEEESETSIVGFPWGSEPLEPMEQVNVDVKPDLADLPPLSPPLQNTIENKPVVPKLLKQPVGKKNPHVPSIKKLFDQIRPELGIRIKEEIMDEDLYDSANEK